MRIIVNVFINAIAFFVVLFLFDYNTTGPSIDNTTFVKATGLCIPHGGLMRLYFKNNVRWWADGLVVECRDTTLNAGTLR